VGAAERWAKQVEAKKAIHEVVIAPRGQRRSFREAAEEFLRTRVGNRSTTAHYGYSLRNHVYGFEVAAGVAFGDLADVEVSREHVKSLVRHLTDRFAPNTVASIFIAVAAVFTDLRKSGVIERSPCANVPLPEHVESCVFVPVTLQQLDTLASRLHGPWQIAPYLGHAAGLRIGEALAVRLDQLVEGEEGWVLRITRQVLGAQRLAPLKHRRADQFREVPVPEFLYQRIMEHAERWSIPEDGFLCPGRSAPYVHRPSFYEDFRDGVGPRNCRTNSLSIGCGTTSRRGVSVGGCRFHRCRGFWGMPARRLRSVSTGTCCGGRCRRPAGCWMRGIGNSVTRLVSACQQCDGMVSVLEVLTCGKWVE